MDGKYSARRWAWSPWGMMFRWGIRYRSRSTRQVPERSRRAGAKCWGTSSSRRHPGSTPGRTRLTAFGIDQSDPDRAFAIVDPDGNGPRCLLKVPEGKTAKNRVHLDVGVEPSELPSRAAELVALGATNVTEFDEPDGYWITMLDPEGNEFCLH